MVKCCGYDFSFWMAGCRQSAFIISIFAYIQCVSVCSVAIKYWEFHINVRKTLHLVYLGHNSYQRIHPRHK